MARNWIAWSSVFRISLEAVLDEEPTELDEFFAGEYLRQYAAGFDAPDHSAVSRQWCEYKGGDEA